MPTRALTFAIAFVLCAVPAVAQLQSKHQIRCLKELQKAGVQVSQAQGKEGVSCVKSEARGKLAPMSPDTCLSADMKQRVQKKQDRALLIAGARCAVETPDFGGTDPETVNGVGVQSQMDLVADLFGPDLTSSLVACSDDRDACNCQVKTLKAAVDLSMVQLKEYSGCAKRATKVSQQPFVGGARSAADLASCLVDASTPWSVAADERGKVAKSAAGIGKVVASKCVASGLFPGTCDGLSGSALSDCVEDRVDCSVCLAVNAMFDLGADCDDYDDGLANASCN